MWRPRQTTRNIGRPQRRLAGDIKEVRGKQKIRGAQERERGKDNEEAYNQECISTYWERR